MAKINQIQSAILNLDGGAFQKLADSYLLRKGYPQINPIGSVTGSNKSRKGTPDTLIPTTDGKYIFAEYTTEAKNRIFTKFSDDIDKCFDEKKTGIPISKIKEMVLCFTSEMSPENLEKLREKCESKGVDLNIYGIGAISFDLLEKYPSIAKDHLGIEVDSGQIVPLDKFLSLYEKNKLTTPLKTGFHFREDEKRNLLEIIENNDLVIVTGKAGVGKSRLAVECYQEFIKKNVPFKRYCIFNKGLDLYEDVKSYFSDSGDFLIFVDDANRISGFQYILQLLLTTRTDQNFKIIITVRDYALNKIKDACKPFGPVAEITLNRFSDEEIKKLVQDEFKINNQLYLDRIIDISKGNPRLAIMAAQIAKESNTLRSIRDVSELYEEYFSSIKSDLDNLNDKEIKKIAGIIAFFRNVDRTDNNLMSCIENEFGIPADSFWESANRLHDMEAVDMFENEIVKISDQVLSTYLFFIVFIKEKLIDFSILIENLFPRFKHRLIDAMNPLLNTFDFKQTKQSILPSVNKVWDKIHSMDENIFLQLISVFWFLKPTETLLFMQKKIESINGEEICIDEIKFEADSNSSLPDFLSTLPLFQFLGSDETLTSLDLIMQYVEKIPKDVSAILNCFFRNYGFRPNSFRIDYQVQQALIEKISEQCDSGRNEFFSRIFIAVAKMFLKTHFDIAESKNSRAVNIIQFDLFETEGLTRLRKLILTNLFNLYKVSKLQNHILELLAEHTQSRIEITVGSIIKKDSELLLKFFEKELDSTNLYHCIIIQNYIRLLRDFKIPFDNKLKRQFQSKTHGIYDLFTSKFHNAELELSYEEYQQFKNKKITEISAQFSKDDYNRFFYEIHRIPPTIYEHSKWEINQGLISIFHELFARNPDLYVEVIEEYLQKGEFLNLDPREAVSDLISSIGSESSYNILSRYNYPTIDQWLFCYYRYLPRENTCVEHLSKLYSLYINARSDCFIYDLDYLLKYEDIENGFIIKIIKIFIDRVTDKSLFPHALSLIFNQNTKIKNYLFSLSSSHYKILEKAYFIADKVEPHVDYDGTCFSLFIDNDEDFLNRYIENKYSEKSYLSRHDGKRDYSFIWQRKDYQSLMKKISEIIFTKGQTYHSFGYLESFFNKNTHPQKDEKIIEKQDNYLSKEIIDRNSDKKYMYMLFSVIAVFESERKVKFYKLFLKTNNIFDDFKSLPFEPMFSVHSNEIQMLQQKIDFYEIVRTFCNSVNYLKHRYLIEQRINALRQEIQSAKRRDFTEEL